MASVISTEVIDNINYDLYDDGTAKVKSYQYFNVSVPTDVVIPDTVKASSGVEYNVIEIETRAYQNQTAIKTVTIGKNVTTIGTYAFYGCYNIKTVTFYTASAPSMGTNSFNTAQSNSLFRTVNIISYGWASDDVFTEDVGRNTYTKFTYEIMLTQSTFNINVDGVWEQFVGFVNVKGSWKEIEAHFMNVKDNWKEGI